MAHKKMTVSELFSSTTRKLQEKVSIPELKSFGEDTIAKFANSHLEGFVPEEIVKCSVLLNLIKRRMELYELSIPRKLDSLLSELDSLPQVLGNSKHENELLSSLLVQFRKMSESALLREIECLS